MTICVSRQPAQQPSYLKGLATPYLVSIFSRSYYVKPRIDNDVPLVIFVSWNKIGFVCPTDEVVCLHLRPALKVDHRIFFIDPS